MSDAETHIRANDQWASEARVLTAYQAGDMDCYAETDEGVTTEEIPWVDIDWDDEKAKRSVTSWDIVAHYSVEVADGHGVTAVDVDVQVGEAGGAWYISTTDDSGGSDDCTDESYDSRQEAIKAAKEFAESRDECDGMSADEWKAAKSKKQAEADLDPDGEYLLAHADGSPWGTKRYSGEDGARRAEVAWYDGVSDANPGTNIIWHLMDCPHAARLVDGKVEILSEQDDL
jgi:hypothetical protein